MRNVILTLAVLAAVSAATPALANEGRVEARGGLVFGSGDSEGVAGVAAGYDWDLGDTAFAGVEVSGDKILQDNTRVVFGFTGRVGVKTGEKVKLFADGGYSTKPCSFCEDSIHAGAGVEVGLGEKVYGKLGYRHFFVGNGSSDFDSVVAGVGFRF
jgi:outer membrane immunogenic protein